MNVFGNYPGFPNGAKTAGVHAVTSVVAWLRSEVEDAELNHEINSATYHQPMKTPTTNLLADFLLVALENMGF